MHPLRTLTLAATILLSATSLATGIEVSVFTPRGVPVSTIVTDDPANALVSFARNVRSYDGLADWTLTPDGQRVTLSAMTGETCDGSVGHTGGSSGNLSADVVAGPGASVRFVTPQDEPLEDEAAWDRAVIRNALTDDELQLAAYINKARVENGLYPLMLLPRLNYIAIRHTMSMDRTGLYSHCNEQGADVASRGRRAGIKAFLGSNQMKDRAGRPDAVVLNWLLSPPHRAALLSNTVVYLGVGVSRGYSEMYTIHDKCVNTDPVMDACAGAFAAPPARPISQNPDDADNPVTLPGGTDSGSVQWSTQASARRVRVNASTYRITTRFRATRIDGRNSTQMILINRRESTGRTVLLTLRDSNRNGVLVWSTLVRVPSAYRSRPQVWMNRFWAGITWRPDGSPITSVRFR